MAGVDVAREQAVSEARLVLCDLLRKSPASTRELHGLLGKKGFTAAAVREALWRLTDVGHVQLTLDNRLKLVSGNGKSR